MNVQALLLIGLGVLLLLALLGAYVKFPEVDLGCFPVLIGMVAVGLIVAGVFGTAAAAHLFGVSAGG